jgi:hypothetical protein
MKQPNEYDFTVSKSEAGIDVTFKPSDSHYSFNLLADAADIARYGRLVRT